MASTEWDRNLAERFLQKRDAAFKVEKKLLRESSIRESQASGFWNAFLDELATRVAALNVELSSRASHTGVPGDFDMNFSGTSVHITKPALPPTDVTIAVSSDYRVVEQTGGQPIGGFVIVNDQLHLEILGRRFTQPAEAARHALDALFG